MLIATVETLFLAYSVISASFVSLPWYIAFDIFVGDKKDLELFKLCIKLIIAERYVREGVCRNTVSELGS